MNETQRTKFAGLVSIRNSEVGSRWNQNQLFCLVNSAVMTLVTTQLKVTDAVYPFVCFGTLILCTLWIVLIILSRRWILYWDSMLGALEALDNEPVSVFRGEVWRETRFKWPGASLALIGLAVSFGLAWFGMFCYWVYTKL